MTEAVGTARSMALPRTQGSPRGKETPGQMPGFSRALEEDAGPAGRQQPPGETGERPLRLAALIGRLSAALQGDAGPAMAGSRASVSAQEAQEAQPRAMRPVQMEPDEEREAVGAGTGEKKAEDALGGFAPVPTEHREPIAAATRTDMAGAVAPGPEAGTARTPKARPEMEAPSAPRAQGAEAPPGPAAKAPLHGQPAMTDATEARQDGRAGGRDAESGRLQPVRIVSLHTAPAPGATPSAMSGTGASLVSGLEASPAFASAAGEAARAMAAGARGTEPVHTLKIQLHPAELGMVTARLKVSDGQLSIELQVETAEARQRLNADGEAMTRALRALGYEVDRITVQQAPSGGTPSAGNQANGHVGGRDSGPETGTGEGRSGGGAADAQGEKGSGRREAGGRQEQRHGAARGGLYI